MSKRKIRTFSKKFKVRITLEALKGEKTLVEIATRHNVLPRSVADWKEDFLENMDIVFAKDKALSHREFLELLLEDENNNRRDNSYKKRYAKAKFPQRKTIEGLLRNE